MTEQAPPLSLTVFDRAAEHRSDDAWLAEEWQRARIVVISANSTAPVTADAGGTVRAQLRSAADFAPDVGRRFLGVAGDEVFFTVTAEQPDGERWQRLRDVGPTTDHLDAGLLVSAVALEQWHQRHTHCPLCGEPTVESQAGWTRTCPADDSQHFPRTDPAVIMLIHDGRDHALLGRGPQWAEGRFSTLAGFVEPGESLESAVAREVFEEVGVAVTDLRYMGSQPWPFPASLMLGFFGRLDGDRALTLDPVEVADAGWFSRAEISAARDWTDTEQPAQPGSALRAVPPRFSIARYLIDRWLAGER